MSNYSLQKYKGTSTRHTCPNCGDRRSFAYYVDESGTPLHPSVGRCNHESGCGYHYTPKQYFHDHPECRTAGDFSSGRQCMAQKPKQPLQQTVTGYIPPLYVEKSQSVHSNFCHFLSMLLDSYYGSKAKEVLERLMEDYRLGATRDGAVIFWQVDRENKVRTGKVMQYNPGDGHRVKDGQAAAVNWIHSILKRQRVLAEEWQLSQCLFGEHLLPAHPLKPVGIVESEKTALICSLTYPKLLWLATGGKYNFTPDRFLPLSGRIINAMKQAGTINPLMLLDEVDKLGVSHNGDPAAALLEVLDGEQNSTFRDHFVELPYDLSKVLFMCTANSLDTIPGPLRDRMEIIELSSYTTQEKLHIAEEHLLEKQRKRHGLTAKQLKIKAPDSGRGAVCDH